jgi:hypothetical protein
MKPNLSWKRIRAPEHLLSQLTLHFLISIMREDFLSRCSLYTCCIWVFSIKHFFYFFWYLSHQYNLWISNFADHWNITTSRWENYFGFFMTINILHKKFWTIIFHILVVIFQRLAKFQIHISYSLRERKNKRSHKKRGCAMSWCSLTTFPIIISWYFFFGINKIWNQAQDVGLLYECIVKVYCLAIFSAFGYVGSYNATRPRHVLCYGCGGRWTLLCNFLAKPLRLKKLVYPYCLCAIFLQSPWD